MSKTLELTKQLISRPSVTPNDAGCQPLLAERLQAMGFSIEHLRFDDVDNLWAYRGSQSPVIVFAGHTDVVPPGPLDQWQTGPFMPTIRNGFLYGRGAADMKGSIAAMLTACEDFLSEYSNFTGTLAFLITSDEEGVSINGTKKVIEHLKAKNQIIDYAIVGEATSEKQLGDMIKNGRRGTLSGKLIVHGKQGHIAYPHIAINPIHLAAPAIQELTATVWDQGNDFFQPTSFQISNIHAGTGAGNVIPGELEIRFNFRFSPEVTAKQLQAKVHALLDKYKFKYDLAWDLSGEPFLTKSGILVQACKKAIKEVVGIEPALSTSGGTSDGRFIATMGCEIIELGPVNTTIHQVNECVGVEELDNLTLIYQRLLTYLMDV